MSHFIWRIDNLDLRYDNINFLFYINKKNYKLTVVTTVLINIIVLSDS